MRNSMMKVPVSELSGAALDWAVAISNGFECGLIDVNRHIFGCNDSHGRQNVIGHINNETVSELLHARYYRPSTDWAQGGPLIDSYQVALVPEANDGEVGTESSDRWIAEIYYDGGEHYATGADDSALIAICRAVVGSKLGDVVQVPVELVSDHE